MTIPQTTPPCRKRARPTLLATFPQYPHVLSMADKTVMRILRPQNDHEKQVNYKVSLKGEWTQHEYLHRSPRNSPSPLSFKSRRRILLLSSSTRARRRQDPTWGIKKKNWKVWGTDLTQRPKYDVSRLFVVFLKAEMLDKASERTGMMIFSPRNPHMQKVLKLVPHMLDLSKKF